MTQPTLTLLVLSDAHFDSAHTDGGKLAGLNPSLGAELAARAWHDATRRHGHIDAVILCGDILHAGNAAPHADYATFRDTLDLWTQRTPILAAPGNCDITPAFFETFNAPGLHTLGGYRVFIFADTYPDGPAKCVRTNGALTEFTHATAESDTPLIVLQHNPILPFETTDIIKPPANAAAIRQAYSNAGVTLSLSGHNHAGQDLCTDAGVNYMTVQSLGIAPHAYTVLTIIGREISVQKHTLTCHPAMGLWDTHVHTPLAYCANDIAGSQTVVERAKQIGLAGIAFAEHAPQLYMTGEDFWGGEFLQRPVLWRRRGQDRMGDYLRAVTPFLSDSVKLGLEVEVDCDGALTCHDEDLARLDFRLGAIHWLPEDTTGWTDAQLTAGLLKTTDALLAAGVDVLAHPMRFLHRKGQPASVEACKVVARMLMETGTVCELNYHKNTPLRPLVEECLALGVPFTFGSDAHAMWEVGNFGSGVAMLRQVTGTDDIAPLLWRPW